MQNPKISVIMPVYNSSNYLKTSIESILNQTFSNFEFIIIDDCSTDNSINIINEYEKKDKRIKVIKNITNIGITKSLNMGLFKAKGKYIVRMDADDWSYPDRFERQIRYMQKNDDIGVSGGAIEVCNADLIIQNIREYPETDKKVRDSIFLYSPFAHPATIWNAKLMKKNGGYNENIPLSQDCELYFKIGKDAKFGNIKDKLIKLRMHKNSSSMLKNIVQEKYAIYARLKAIMEYGYITSFKDKYYMLIRLVVMYLIPKQVKFMFFNLIRRNI